MDHLITFAVGLTTAGAIWLIAHLLDQKKKKRVKFDEAEIYYED
jgi:hypothetical protein